MLCCWGMSMIAICCRIFSLVSDVGIAPRLLWLGLPRKVTVHVLLDFFKAFDLINHRLFVHKLDSRYDFHTSAMDMVSSFLRDRSMVVEVDGVKSTPRSLSSNIPQGWIASPQFFLCLSMICLRVFVVKVSSLCWLSTYWFIWGRIWMEWGGFLDGRLRLSCYLIPASCRQFRFRILLWAWCWLVCSWVRSRFHWCRLILNETFKWDVKKSVSP
jgi:hypothetical protein